MSCFVDAFSRIKRGREDDGFKAGEKIAKKQKGGTTADALIMKKRTEEAEEVPEFRPPTSYPVDVSDWLAVGSDGFDLLVDGLGLQVLMDYAIVEQLCLGWVPSELLSFCGEGDNLGQISLWEDDDDIWRLREIHETPSMPECTANGH